jgi:hypothetical protein
LLLLLLLCCRECSNLVVCLLQLFQQLLLVRLQLCNELLLSRVELLPLLGVLRHSTKVL